MGFDRVKVKQVAWMLLYVAGLILLLKYSGIVFLSIKLMFRILSPFIIGACIAFILNIPMNGIEKKLLGRWKGKLANAVKRPLSMILSMIFVCTIVALVLLAVVPELSKTVTTLGTKITPFFQDTIAWLEKMTTDSPVLTDWLDSLKEIKFDWEMILTKVGKFLQSGVGSVVGSTFVVANSIISGFTNAFFAFIFAIYVLSQKEKLQNQALRILDAYAKPKVAKAVREVAGRLYVNFSNFICGQCLEAVILGMMFIIAMSIFKMPYAIMIGTLIAFTALIPIVGAFIGCGVGVFMILIEDPIMALWFIVLFNVLQQLEGNLIYPRVVGNSVGLPSMWVLLSVSVGGSLFGVVGMLSFIPLMSTVYSLLRDDVNRRNRIKKNNITIENGLNSGSGVSEENSLNSGTDVSEENSVNSGTSVNKGNNTKRQQKKTAKTRHHVSSK